jgi:hypothetical protein
MVALLFHLRNRPGTPYFPQALKHRWSVGLMALGVPFIAFPLPFLLVGEPAAALVAVFLIPIATWILGRELVRGIIEDLGEHVNEGRSLFHHSRDCRTNEEV